jgi:hypothetical protein
MADFDSVAAAQPQRPQLPVGWQPNLQRMLSDIVPMLSAELRHAFREFVKSLKAKRDAREIPSLSVALMEQAPQVVGTDLWQQCIDRQREEAVRQAAAAAGHQYTQQQQPPQPAFNQHDADQRRMARRATLEADIFRSTRAPSVDVGNDVLEDGDLFNEDQVEPKARKPKKSPPSDFKRWAECNVLDAATCRAKLEKAAAKRGITVDPNDSACELLSRAAELFVKDAVEATIVHSRRRRNDEARRISRQGPEYPLQIRPSDIDVKSHVAASKRVAEKDGLLLDAMVDFDVLNGKPESSNAPQPRSVWATAKRQRGRELESARRQEYGGLTEVGDRLELSMKKVKKEEERVSKARPNIEDAHYLRESRPELAPEVLFCG